MRNHNKSYNRLNGYKTFQKKLKKMPHLLASSGVFFSTAKAKEKYTKTIPDNVQFHHFFGYVNLSIIYVHIQTFFRLS